MPLTWEHKQELLSQLEAEHAQLKADLKDTLNALRKCEYPKLKRRRGKIVPTALPRHIQDLENRTTRILARLAEITEDSKDIRSAHILLEDAEVSPRRRTQGIKRKISVPVLVRDITILKYADLSDDMICRKLDADLLQHEGPPMGFPDSWREKFHVDTYLAAYQDADCRGLVQKLISMAKKRTSPLP